MMKGRRLIMWSHGLKKPRFCGLLDEWCRHLSSLRREARPHKFAAIPVEQPLPTKAQWENSVADPFPWGDNSSIQGTINYPYFALTRKEFPLSNRPHVWIYGNYGGERQDSVRLARGEEGSTVGAWIKICKEGQLSEAVEALDCLVHQGYHVHYTLFCDVLKRCILQNDLLIGRHVHCLALQSGIDLDKSVANQFIRMYSSHAMLPEAMQVFTRVTGPDTAMWCSIILAHAEHGEPTKAIQLYRQMRYSRVKPNKYVFVAVLKACSAAGDVTSGKDVHADFMHSGVERDDVFVGSCLVDMYAKCGTLVDARTVFDQLSSKSVVMWNAMISGYCRHGCGQDALRLYGIMQQEGMTAANHVTFVCVLKACSSVGALQEGKQLHAEIQARGLGADLVIGNCLVNMYAKCGSLEDAHRVFNGLPTRDVVTWNSIIAGYAQRGMCQEALYLYARMQEEHTNLPNYVTFVCLLQACATVGALHHGKQLHAHICKRGLETDLVVSNCLLDMYAKCGRLKDARQVFDRMSTRNVVTWTALLNGYAEHSDASKAMQCYEEMRQQGVDPNDATFACLLVACSHEGLVTEGRRYFRVMSEDHGITPTLQHYNCMVDLLGRSGHLDEAENMLRSMPFETDIVGWTTLLSACKSYGDLERGRRCFDQLIRLEPGNATPYALLASMYADSGRWRDVDKIETWRKSAGAWKKAAKACIEVKNEVHEFTVGEETSDISSKLKSMNLRVKEGGHVPHTQLVLQPVSDSQKEDALCGHAEKLALAYGLMNTADGTPLLVTKNLRMCSDCHSSTKHLARLEKREIIVRDAHRVHRFLDGACSCGDRL